MSENEEIRSEKISAVITPSLLARLKTYARRNHWSRSTAIEVLIEQGISEDAQGSK